MSNQGDAWEDQHATQLRDLCNHTDWSPHADRLRCLIHGDVFDLGRVCPSTALNVWAVAVKS